MIGDIACFEEEFWRLEVELIVELIWRRGLD
jgi:hypothetical protein